MAYRGRKKLKVVQPPRPRRAGFSLSEEEYRLICSYLEKYNIKNRSRWIRETLVNHMQKNLGIDYPTLFDENEMRR